VQEFIPSNYDIITFLVESGLVSSKSEARRVIAQGGVKVDGQQVDSPEFKLSKGQIVQKGKIKFLKVS
jgi:tyrosyl-tRNA synthetase